MNHLPISAYNGLLKFDMKIFLSKVRNRPVVYLRHEVGASMYFGHIYWKKIKIENVHQRLLKLEMDRMERSTRHIFLGY